MTDGRAGAARDIEIRPAALDDLDALVDIYLSSANHHVSLDPDYYRVPDRAGAIERLRGILEDEGRTWGYLAAAVDGRIVGSVSIALLSPPTAGSMMAPVPTAEIGIAVLEEARDAGIGTAMMAAAEAWAVERGIRAIILDMSVRNTAAQRFYERLGYATNGLYLRKAIG